MDKKYCLLLIEDDYALAMGTEYTLKAEGYVVKHAKNLAEARKLLSDSSDDKDTIEYGRNSNNSGLEQINLILLDVMLPDGSGFDFLEEIRNKKIEMPVIFLTAVGDEANIVRGLDLGADDYVTKPYRVRELLSRISAILRRAERMRQTVDDSAKNSGKSNHINADEYSFGSHILNASDFRLYKDGEAVECTPSEIRLLREFLRNNGIVLTRNQLIEKLYDTENSYIDDNTLSVYIKRLRDKLGEDAVYIRTVKGVGYRFSETE